ncbi:MAG TPA: cation diffusion facilitator family transporter [Parasegetibacter sp.]
MNTRLKNLRLQKLVVVVAIVLFIIKVIAYLLTNSVAVLTDALESTINVIAGLIGLYSLYVSAKPRDLDHPYGHGKAEFISAAVEGTLILIAGLIIIYEGTRKLLTPHPLYKIDTGIILIGISALVNFVVGQICVNTGKRNNSLALIASGNHLKTDTYSTVAVTVGLILIYFTEIMWIDSVVAIAMGFFIIFTGYKILRTSIAGIMDEADEALLSKMIATLNSNRRPNWIDLHNLRVIKYGSILHIDCHLTVPWYLNVEEGHSEVEALGSLIRNEYGESIELFVHTDGCREFSCPICIKENCPVRQHSFVKKLEWSVENILTDAKHSVEMG